MMYLQTLFLLLLCSCDAGFGSRPQRHSRRASDSCHNFVDGPFGLCSKAGYNTTFIFPDILTDSVQKGVAGGMKRMITSLGNCSQNGLAETIACSFFIPQCSGGRRVYPCKRVCGEFLKQCLEDLPVRFMDYIIANCHVLPNELASSGKCFEPPNFTTNDSIKGPLDRGCQELIIPACKNLGVSNHTLIGADLQKDWYLHTYHKRYSPESAETGFPAEFQGVLNKYPKCQENLKKMFCGEFFPPCFPEEGQGFYSICQSVCDDIVRDCPDFFSKDLPLADAEFCSLLGKGNTSHGHCKRAEWPKPFSWVRFMIQAERATGEAPSKGPKGTKVWVIVVAVIVALIIVGLILLGAICLKMRRLPSLGYKKQQDDMAPLETSVDL